MPGASGRHTTTGRNTSHDQPLPHQPRDPGTPGIALRRGYADTRFGQLHYAEAGSGPVLLMLHQTPRSHDEFAELQPLLADGFRTIAMDMIGFALSAPTPLPHTIETMAEAGWALLDALDIDSAVLLGHHTGAVVAQEMAVQAPGRSRALVLSALPWIDDARRSRPEIDVDNAPVREDGGHLAELWRLRRPYYPAGRPDLLDRFIRDALNLAPDVDPAEGHRAVRRYLMDRRIPQVSAPVLLLTPTEDPFAVGDIPAVSEALAGVPVLESRELVGAGVPAMEQCADQVAGHVRDFLARLA